MCVCERARCTLYSLYFVPSMSLLSLARFVHCQDHLVLLFFFFFGLAEVSHARYLLPSFCQSHSATNDNKKRQQRQQRKLSHTTIIDIKYKTKFQTKRKEKKRNVTNSMRRTDEMKGRKERTNERNETWPRLKSFASTQCLSLSHGTCSWVVYLWPLLHLYLRIFLSFSLVCNANRIIFIMA